MYRYLSNVRNWICSIKSAVRYQWTGNVGLVSVNDFLRASTNPNCTSISDQYDLESGTSSPLCNQNYLLNILDDGHGYWTISPAFSYYLFNTTEVWAIFNNYRFSGVGAVLWPAAESLDVYPVLYLKSTIQITGGAGTQSNPYIIG